jgi:hypothetical protein
MVAASECPKAAQNFFRLIQALTTAPNRAHKGCGVARPSIEAGTYVDLPTVRSSSNGNAIHRNSDAYTVTGTDTYTLEFLGGDDRLTIDGGTFTTAWMGNGNDLAFLRSGAGTVYGEAGSDRFDLSVAAARGPRTVGPGGLPAPAASPVSWRERRSSPQWPGDGFRNAIPETADPVRCGDAQG